MNKRNLGSYYEDLAIQYLIKNGVRIVDRNVYLGFAELDVVFYDKDYLVFCEIKYRKKDIMGYGYNAIDNRKKKRMMKAAYTYLARKNMSLELPIRFDVISIDGKKLKWFRNAFMMDYGW